MAKMIRMMVDVARDNMAAAIEALTDLGATVAMGASDGSTSSNGNGMADVDVEEVHTPATRKPRSLRTAANGVESMRGRRVVYTPAGTAKQIQTALAKLRDGSLSAYVLKDLVKHPGSSNAEVRERLTTTAKRIGASVESVDNIIWKHVQEGRVKKTAQVSE